MAWSSEPSHNDGDGKNNLKEENIRDMKVWSSLGYAKELDQTGNLRHVVIKVLYQAKT